MSLQSWNLSASVSKCLWQNWRRGRRISCGKNQRLICVTPTGWRPTYMFESSQHLSRSFRSNESTTMEIGKYTSRIIPYKTNIVEVQIPVQATANGSSSHVFVKANIKIWPLNSDADLHLYDIWHRSQRNGHINPLALTILNTPKKRWQKVGDEITYWGMGFINQQTSLGGPIKMAASNHRLLMVIQQQSLDQLNGSLQGSKSAFFMSHTSSPKLDLHRFPLG